MSRFFTTMKDDIYEALVTAWVCLTSFWFWLPVMYGGYIVLQIWLLVAVNPLTILILPAIISALLIITREKRMKTQYGIADGKPKSLQPFSLTPGERANVSWDVEKALEDYKKLMRKKEKD